MTNISFIGDLETLSRNNSPLSFIDRKQELASLAYALIKDKCKVAAIFGSPGIGKTTLAMRFSEEYRDNFSGGIFIINSTENIALSDIALSSIEDTRKESLLIINNAEVISQYALNSEIDQIIHSRPKTQILLTSRSQIQLGLLIGYACVLKPFSQETFHSYINQVLGSKAEALNQDALYISLQGNPALIEGALISLRDYLLTPEELLRSLEPYNKICLLGPDGRPLNSQSDSYKSIISDISDVSDELLVILAKEPKKLYELSPRLFEKVIAELLSRMGYEVNLTPATRDGGKDIYAVSKTQVGSFLYVVECKKYAPDHHVGVELLRQLYGVVQVEKATAGILATTSYFTKDAKEFQSKISFQMSLQDYLGIQSWLNKVSLHG